MIPRPSSFCYARLVLFLALYALSSIDGRCLPSSGTDAGVVQSPFPGKIPGQVSGKIETVVINSSNIAQFSSSVIKEFLPLIRSGKMSLEATQDLSYPWPKLVQSNPSNEKEQLNINADGGISIRRLSPGLAFPVSTENPDKLLGKKIAWDIQSSFWSHKIISFTFELIWLNDTLVDRRVGGDFARVYPPLLEQKPTSIQLFRERVRLLEPKAISGLSWLTYRFLGPDEDALWIHSPAIKKTRQLTGSNRSDPLIHSGLSLDDLLVWSGKNEMVDASFVQEVVALAPFPALVKASAQSAGEGCYEAVRPNSETTWNFQSKRFLGAAPWLATNSIYVTRKLYRLELSTRDPYSLFGRQIVYVDAETMLPLYKIVYSREGKPWQVVIGGFGLAQSADKQQTFPYLSFTSIYDVQKQIGYVLEVKDFTVCSQLPDRLSLASFDPRKME